MLLFDSHSHIDDKSFDKDREAVLERAKEAHVRAVMIAGITETSCARALEVARTRPGLFTSVGIHPHDAKSASGKALAKLAKLAEDPLVRAWGETGLDFDRMFSPKAVQEKWFARQLDMAARLRLPLILHERATRGRLLEILSSHPVGPEKGVVHCFSGTDSELLAYLDLGFSIGITGILTHKQRGAPLRALAGRIPRDRLLIETDAPYLAPSPLRNKHKRNEPAFVAAVLETLARIRGDNLEDLAAAIWKNTCRLFKVREKEIDAQ